MPINAQPLQLGPWRTVRYDIPSEECAPDELTDMQNTRIGTAGQVESRPGTLSYKGKSALGSSPTLTLAAQFNSNATTSHVVIVADAAIYKYDSGWSAITGGTTITAGDDNTWEWVNADGTFVMTNGVDTDAIKWTGSGNATALDDDGRFSKGRHIAWFDNRLWIGNVNGATGQLWYSDIAAIETWGATSFINFGGIIRGLVPTQNALTVHTTDGIYTVIPTGNSVNPFSINQRTGSNLSAPLAAEDGRSIVALPNDFQVMVLRDGIYEWTGGAEINKISFELDDGYWDTINADRLFQSFACFFPRENEVWFALPYGTSQTNMNHIMAWNRKTRGWHGPYEGWERNCCALIDDKLHLGDFAGILWDHDTGDEDNATTAIDAWFETGAPPPMGADIKVRWLQARHYYDGKGNFNVTASQFGADLVGASETVSMDGTGFTLGTDILGAGVLGPVTQISQDVSLTGYGPTSSIKISQNAINQSFLYRKIVARFKPLGRFGKPKPVDV
jgi:hypothetical protein